MQDEIGDERLLERGGEALDQLVRQAADEADGVGDQVLAPVLLEGARGRVERLEQPVLDRDAGAGERVQQRRLAGVGVAGQRDRRLLAAAALLAPGLAPLGELGQPPLQHRDAVARLAAVALELRSRPGRACRRRRRAVPGASTSRACAAGCTRAAPARPGACPRRCAHAGRRCRGSAGCGRPRGPRARSRACAAAPARSRRRRSAPRRPASAKARLELGRACPCRRRSGDRAGRGAGRSRRSTATPAVRASSRSSAISLSASTPCGKTASAKPRSGSAPGAGSGWCAVTPVVCPLAPPASSRLCMQSHISATKPGTRALEPALSTSNGRNQAARRCRLSANWHKAVTEPGTGGRALSTAGRPQLTLGSTFGMTPSNPTRATSLAELTLELVNIPSPSKAEAALAERIASLLPARARARPCRGRRHLRASAPERRARSCSSPGTSTPSRRRRTCPGGSRTAP